MKVLAFVLLAAITCEGAVLQQQLQDRIVLYQDVLPPQLRADAIKRAGKIVGGTDVAPNSVPYQCALRIDTIYFCGCSVIDRLNVLTAAHCVDNANSVEIVFGEHNLDADDGTELTIRTTSFRVHESWNPSTFINDVAIIYLPSPLTFNPTVQPIALADIEAPSYEGDMLTVTGWGKPSDSYNGLYPILRQVSVPGISVAVCAGFYGSTRVTNSTLCVDTTDGYGPCNGDSGGPLTFGEGTEKIQVGIVSFGSSLGCEAELPAGFSRVSSFRQWIDDNIQRI